MVLPFSRALLLSTSVAALYASGLTAYAVGSNEPEFVADFAGVLNSGTEYYRSGGADTTFSSVFTHSGLVLPATMTDSDGDLKWSPHNFLSRSADFSAWTAQAVTVVPGAASAPYGLTAAKIYPSSSGNRRAIARLNSLLSTPRKETYKILTKNDGWSGFVAITVNGINFAASQAFFFDAANAFTPGTLPTGATASATPVGDGWFLLSVEHDTNTSGLTAFNHFSIALTDADNSIVVSTDGTNGVLVAGAHAYRSDLGGMVNNPDTGDSYVPTTTAALFLPRRNHYIYNGSTYDNAGILIEPAAATNLFLNSSNFTVTWGTFQASISQTGTGPDGVTNSAAILTDDGGGGTGSALIQLANPNYEVAANSTQVQSIYAKANGSNFLCMEFDNLTAPATDTRAWFNLSAGTVGTTTADVQAATIENVGGGWYRCAVRFTTGADNFGGFVLRICDADNSTSCARDGASSIIVYGCQLEVGSVPTSYIPTAGSTVTRAAETLTAAGSSLPANTTGVSVQMQGRMTYADLGTEAQRTFWRWYNGASDFLLCDLDTDGADTGEVNANQSDTTGGAGTVAIDAYSPGINVAYNIASRHSNTDINLAVDGTAGTADTTPTALHDASSDTFQVAHNLQGTVGMLRVWGVGLSDTDLETAS